MRIGRTALEGRTSLGVSKEYSSAELSELQPLPRKWLLPSSKKSIRTSGSMQPLRCMRHSRMRTARSGVAIVSKATLLRCPLVKFGRHSQSAIERIFILVADESSGVCGVKGSQAG